MSRRVMKSRILITSAWCLSLLSGKDAAPVADPAVNLAPSASKPEIFAVRLRPGEKIVLDGHLDEPAWKRAQPATHFRQQDPKYGQPATEHTEVRLLYDAHNLYMGVYCYDSKPNKLMGNQMLRDGFLSADDRFMWVIDPYLNGRDGYYFEVNPSGAMGDSLVGTSGNERAWDGIWNARVRHTSKGWVVEVELPFHTLNFDAHAPAWGVNFQRTIRRKNEEDFWTGWGRNQNLRNFSNEGLLEGLMGESQGLGLEVRPYVLGNFSATPGIGGTPTLKGTGGLDMFYSVTPQLRANLTVNTDFAETEVDQRRVNLTQFPLFFPEKRSFFLEGASFFDFARFPGNSVMPFFSRQIGLDANGMPQRIDYGGKLTGQVGAYDVGLLQVRTAPDATAAGEDFTVLRTKRRFLSQSYVGALYTRRAGRGTNTPQGQTAGADFALSTSHFHGNQNLQLSGFYLWTSHSQATYPSPSGGGAAYGLRLDYPNDRWNLHAGYREMQDAYNPAVGFYDRRGIRHWDLITAFQPRPKNSQHVRRYSYSANLGLDTDMHNQPLTGKLDLIPFDAQFQSGDDIQFHVQPNYDRLISDFEIYPGITLRSGNAYNFTRYFVRFNTAARRRVSVNGDYGIGTFYSGHRRVIDLGLNLRPRRGILIGLDNSWNRVTLKEGAFSTSVPRLSANVQFNPWISIANTVQYDNLSRVLGWQTRFRWILQPGNDIYVVYTRDSLSNLDGVSQTYDWSLATKVAYTLRF